ncbi:DUF547 domain-containing protein [Shewanella sp. 202IG2-18]|uniref:DUF547 domain-containing protein n=1 Tax=Parashewanella hymeniacidonis TaxID=2807618 RepID=UPI0019614126|nr:DUF547 domain-containing protein [Parashewanella hymeniacidonis]MBM7073931.1 DUF547 domain-containing protein [Parashewanella hymeniacidonis]
MSKFKLLLVVIGVVFSALLIKGYSLYSAITPNALSYWQISDENNDQEIDHTLWQKILDGYLVEIKAKGVRAFNYAQVTQADKKALKSYLQQLESIDPRILNKNEQLSFWVNLYNALTIDVVLDHYPVTSIKDIGDGITGPWNMDLLTIAGQPITLNQIEHKILRPIWQEPRIHYVINCASVGCPDLPNKVFSSKNLDSQLNKAAIRFINQSKAVDIKNNQLKLSSIYSWFSQDFGDEQAELMLHIQTFAEPTLKSKLKAIALDKNSDIIFDYDWKLNAT